MLSWHRVKRLKLLSIGRSERLEKPVYDVLFAFEVAFRWFRRLPIEDRCTAGIFPKLWSLAWACGFFVRNRILEHTKHRFAGEIGASRLRHLLKLRENPKRLPVTLEAAGIEDAVIERDLTAMAERRVAEIVSARDCLQHASLGQVLDCIMAGQIVPELDHQPNRYLRNFERVRETCSIKVTVA